jgi:hypothetical protein
MATATAVRDDFAFSTMYSLQFYNGRGFPSDNCAVNEIEEADARAATKLLTLQC